MQQMRLADEFVRLGGSELSVCSTTSDIEIAIRYAKGCKQALLFRVVVTDFMELAPDISFLSAFPHEKEALYPPLTFFGPLGRKAEKLTYEALSSRLLT